MSRNLVTGEGVYRGELTHGNFLPPLEPTWRKEDPFCEADLGALVGKEALRLVRIEVSRRFEVTSGAELLYEFHSDADGHVTLTCHCPRCEAERRMANLPDGAIGYVERVCEDGTCIVQTDGAKLSQALGELNRRETTEGN